MSIIRFCACVFVVFALFVQAQKLPNISKNGLSPEINHLETIRYVSKQNTLNIYFNFKNPIKEENISKISKNYFKIANVSPIQPAKKAPTILLKALYVFSDQNSLIIAPDSERPLNFHTDLSRDGKTLILHVESVANAQDIFSNTQYIGVLLAFVLIILILYIFKRKLQGSASAPLAFRKYFIDSKSFVLDLEIKGVRYFILSTPRGQTLLNQEVTNAAFNDLLNQSLKIRKNDKKQADFSDFPKKSNATDSDNSASEYEDMQSLTQKLNLKPHRNFHTSPDIAKELDKNARFFNSRDTESELSENSNFALDKIISQIKPVYDAYSKNDLQDLYRQTRHDTVEDTSLQDLHSEDFSLPASQKLQTIAQARLHEALNNDSQISTQSEIEKIQNTKEQSLDKIHPNTQNTNNTNPNPEEKEDIPPHVTFLEKGLDDEKHMDEEDDLDINNFFSQVQEPTLKDKIVSRLKNMLNRNEK